MSCGDETFSGETKLFIIGTEIMSLISVFKVMKGIKIKIK